MLYFKRLLLSYNFFLSQVNKNKPGKRYIIARKLLKKPFLRVFSFRRAEFESHLEQTFFLYIVICLVIQAYTGFGGVLYRNKKPM
jgi:hypothetical protein